MCAKLLHLQIISLLCHGTSDTQVKAIADNVAYEVKQAFGEYVMEKGRP